MSRAGTGKRVGPDGFPEYRGLWWTLARPQVILLVHAGVAGAACARAVSRTSRPWMEIPAALVAGWVLWTGFEYALHRWLLHHTRRPLIRRAFWDGLHREHHSYRAMKDPDHHGVHIAITLPIALAVLSIVASLDPQGPGLAVAAGWVLGYCTYEALHWVFHSIDTAGPIAAIPGVRGLFEAHVVHHLVCASANFGFVTLFWDRLLGTAMLPDARCRVPHSTIPPPGDI